MQAMPFCYYAILANLSSTLTLQFQTLNSTTFLGVLDRYKGKSYLA